MREEMRVRLHDLLTEIRDELRDNDPKGFYERVTNSIYELRGYKSEMTLNSYQLASSATAVYPGRNTFLGLMYVAGKLNGEAGEVAELVFKGLRDDNIAHVDGNMVAFGQLTEDRRVKLRKELGDALWYVGQAAFEIGYSLNEIALDNIVKLASRAERGVLTGSGSDR